MRPASGEIGTGRAQWHTAGAREEAVTRSDAADPIRIRTITRPRHRFPENDVESAERMTWQIDSAGFEARLLSDLDALEEASWDGARAAELIEAARWPDGPTCHHCGEGPVKVSGGSGRKADGPRKWACRACGKTVSVRQGTFLEDSKLRMEYVCGALALAARAGSLDELRRSLRAAGRSDHGSAQWAVTVAEVLERNGLDLGFAVAPADGELDDGEAPVPRDDRSTPTRPRMAPFALAALLGATAGGGSLALAWAAWGRTLPPEVASVIERPGGSTLRVVTRRDPGEGGSALRRRHDEQVRELRLAVEGADR